MSKRIPDLHYKVFPVTPHFSKRGHMLAFYRHDKDGRPYLYHQEHFYGEDGRATRLAAYRRAKAVVNRLEPMGLRNTHIPIGGRQALLEKAGIRKEQST